MALYALNVARRGDRVFGYVLFGASAVALVLLIRVTLITDSANKFSELVRFQGGSSLPVAGEPAPTGRHG